jgi:hypothetical protein
MIAALLLAALPLLAQAEARAAAAPPEATTCSVEEIAPSLAKTALLYVGLAGADLYSTELALRHCPTCSEGNGLGWNSGARGAGKAATMAGALYGDYWLRRHGHRRMANVVRWVVVGAQVIAVGNNVAHAIRGR